MTDEQNDTTRSPNQATAEMDPPGGHSREALEEAAERMHIDTAPDDATSDPDPAGGHDPAALEDAAKKMGSDR